MCIVRLKGALAGAKQQCIKPELPVSWPLLCFCSLHAVQRRKRIASFPAKSPPYSIGTEDKLHAGIAIDIIQAVFEDMGHTVEIEVYPWPRALKNAKLGLYDGIFSVFKTPEREEFLTYPKEPLVSMDLGFYAGKNALYQNITLDNAFEHSIVTVRRASMGEKYAAACFCCCVKSL